jgi:TolA-binding protein
LLAAEAHGWLRLGQHERAAEAYASLLDRLPTAEAAPEAQYFLGVARYRHSHEAKDLLSAWHQLRVRYPESTWRLRQSFNEG